MFLNLTEKRVIESWQLNNIYGSKAIDKVISWGPNLYLMPNQLSIAFSFDSNGKGFNYFTGYCEKLWGNTEFCK